MASGGTASSSSSTRLPSSSSGTETSATIYTGIITPADPYVEGRWPRQLEAYRNSLRERVDRSSLVDARAGAPRFRSRSSRQRKGQGKAATHNSGRARPQRRQAREKLGSRGTALDSQAESFLTVEADSPSSSYSRYPSAWPSQGSTVDPSTDPAPSRRFFPTTADEPNSAPDSADPTRKSTNELCNLQDAQCLTDEEMGEPYPGEVEAAETVVEDGCVSVAMPNLLERAPVLPDTSQTKLAFNWIIRVAPWEMYSTAQAQAMHPYPLLPEQSREHRGRRTLVLDLDETLVHCNVKLSEPGALPLNIIVHIKMAKNSSIPASVYLRPHAQRFLQQAADTFEVVIFTASIEPYAMAVVDLLDKPRQWVAHVLSRESCTEINGQLLKDMRRLGRNLEDVILVDNSPLACGISTENSIVCKSYYGDDDNDIELLYLSDMLRDLNKVNHIPTYLAERYSLTAYLKQERAPFLPIADA